MIDTVRVAELNNELGVIQDSIQRAELRAGAIVAELRAMLDPQPGQVGSPAPAAAPAAVPLPTGDGSPGTHERGQSGLDGRRPTRPKSAGSTPAPRSIEQPGSARVAQERTPDDPVGTPTPASSRIDCPECSEPVTARGLGVHRSRSKVHAAAVNAKARQVVGLPVVTRRPAPAERNPRSTPPLDLAPRIDQAVGE